MVRYVYAIETYKVAAGFERKELGVRKERREEKNPEGKSKRVGGQTKG